MGEKRGKRVLSRGTACAKTPGWRRTSALVLRKYSWTWWGRRLSS